MTFQKCVQSILQIMIVLFVNKEMAAFFIPAQICLMAKGKKIEKDRKYHFVGRL